MWVQVGVSVFGSECVRVSVHVWVRVCGCVRGACV